MTIGKVVKQLFNNIARGTFKVRDWLVLPSPRIVNPTGCVQPD